MPVDEKTRFRRLIAHSPVAPGLRWIVIWAALLCSGIWIRRERFRAASWKCATYGDVLATSTRCRSIAFVLQAGRIEAAPLPSFEQAALKM